MILPSINLISLDESGIDDNIVKEYGYSPIGQRCYGEKPYRCKKRFNIISSFNQNKLFAPFVFEGPCNSSVFSMYMKNVLLPELKP
jgi:putative transposase